MIKGFYYFYFFRIIGIYFLMVILGLRVGYIFDK